MIVAYVIASHKNPAQTTRLACKLAARSSSSFVFIHHDYSASHLRHNFFKAVPNVEIIPKSVNVEWGDISQVQMMLHCMEYILSKKPNFDWIVFISGQDYPIQPVSEIESFLAATEYDGFLTHFSSATGKNVASTIYARYYFSYFKLPKHWRLLKVYKRMAEMTRNSKSIRVFLGSSNVAPRIGIRNHIPLFDDGFICYKGQPWIIINRRCVNYLLQTIRDRPKIINYYSRTLNPDESIFNTILANNSTLRLKNDYMRYIEWPSVTSAHPKVLCVSDYANIVSSGKHFARKFDITVDAEILDMLDRE